MKNVNIFEKVLDLNITLYNILNVDVYVKSKVELSCMLCKNIVLMPSSCNKCKKLYCRKCIIKTTLNYNYCLNCGYKPFETEIPNHEISTLMSKLEIKCPQCNKNISLKDVPTHLLVCMDKHEKIKCPLCENCYILKSKINLLESIPFFPYTNDPLFTLKLFVYFSNEEVKKYQDINFKLTLENLVLKKKECKIFLIHYSYFKR